LAGRLAPQGRARIDGRVGRFDDIHGVGWTLISAVPVADRLSAEQLALLDKLGTRRIVIDVDADIDGYYASYFADNKVAAVLYRPDFYIFGSAAQIDEVGELVDQLFQRLPVLDSATAAA